MNKFRFFLSVTSICLILMSCGGHSSAKPRVLWNAENHMNEGVDAYANAEWGKAKKLFNQALALYLGLDEQAGVLMSYINLAEVALSVNDNLAVQQYLARADDLAKKDALQQYQARIKLLYAHNALQQKQFTRAKNTLQELLPRFDGDKPLAKVDILQFLAIESQTKIAFVQKQNEAVWVLRYANALNMLNNKTPEMKARLLRFQADLSINQGQYADAESGLQQALLIYKKNYIRSGIAATLLALAQCSEKQGNRQGALDYLTRSYGVYLYLKDDDMVKKLKAKLEQKASQTGASLNNN